MSKKQKSKRLIAWVALSDQGEIAYFIGCYHTQAMLEKQYRARFGQGLKYAGYRPFKMVTERAEGSV